MFYNFLRWIIYPFIFIFMILKPKKIKFFKDRLFLDVSCLKKNEKYIWIHCSSVGEVNLSDTIIKKLKETYAENILISVFTDTGYETAKNKYTIDDRVTVLKFPLDSFFILRKIFKYINVTKVILVETEIWPNFINLAHKNSKIFIINGRISNRSYPRYKKIKFILKSLFKKIDGFFMQSEEDKNKIICLGAEEKKVSVTGNLKFDISFEIFSENEMKELKEKINSAGKKIFVAGSTRPGEEIILLDSYSELENTILIIVPRHLERLSEIELIVKNKNLSYKKFSEIENYKTDEDFQILIVDKMGIQRKFYSIADYVFVGGTLVNIGGHSLLEPMFYGHTPIFGPYLQNVKDISKNILELELGYKVENKTEILEAIKTLEKNPISKEKILLFFKKNNNASEKIIESMEEQ